MASSAWAKLSDTEKATIAFGLAMLAYSDPDGQDRPVATIAAKLHLTRAVGEFVKMLAEPITTPKAG